MGVVLITGAAKGLGRAAAELFRSEGWNVVAIDMDESVLQIADEFIHTYVADVTSETEITKVAEQVREAGLSVTVIVNNAGIFEFLPITDTDFQSLQRIFNLNTLAPFLVIKCFLGDLTKNQGRVIQISSENVKLNGLFQPYPSSKIALEALSEGARQELSLMGISLCIIRPGAIKTDLLDWSTPISPVYQSYINRLVSQANERMGKVIAPEKVASLIYEVAKSKRPQYIYSINHNRFLAMFSRLPFRWRDRIVKSMISKG